ncbi:MAG: metallophosphatase family protein [Clostridium sp.]|uniref:metallophosphoesterase family protein n=1 Tax=Clostridium sp. DSM 8431 TaxID=1761781 RepID=UPI0008ED9F88|nr:metallophosphoesterase family protein [Clostridium sp. DSM 8431]MCR4944331.1 metallophosphatase family protein [Clostridium sp.]SFU71763.1 phosphoesterase, MJ0936 family [Clostridium sp. DSM 8431]
MKIAVISDVHGNTENLNVFMNYINKEGIKTVLNLGDIIGGDNPVEALRIIMNDKRFISVRGNHDSSLFLEDELLDEEILWLDSLPLIKTVEFCNKKFLMVHSRIDNNTDMPLLYEGKSLLEFLKDYEGDYDYVLFGHTHYQGLLSYYKGSTMINPGSLGLSYDEKISFCIIDLSYDSISIDMKKYNLIK